MKAYDLEGQHEQLRIDLDRLHLLLLAPAEALPEARMLALLRREAENLSTSLEYHFGFEEKNGYMSEVLQERPGLNHLVTGLQGQHAEILQRLEDLEKEGRNLADVRAGLANVLDTIGEHEREEGSVLQETYSTDLGEGD
jgi:hypothetical protein